MIHSFTFTETEAVVIFAALGEEIEKLVNSDIPRALEANDHVADQRLHMLRQRLTAASEARLLVGETVGLID